ncbi:hypothetical protein O181_005867 [Austropuccinia psidii MF-1]|uniref:Uncharacterized protein n=1 Tax=Austropuccinia psidii MF-1 TaxID=1389203 RepID=A0A9Q3GH27_9BASI|nr:hypothetical protein [Austropuccinia psidii MF-1]
MPIQNLCLTRPTRYQARTKAVITPTTRVTLEETPAVPQLKAHLGRGPVMEWEAPSRKEGRWLRRSSSFSGVVCAFSGISRTTLKGSS